MKFVIMAMSILVLYVTSGCNAMKGKSSGCQCQSDPAIACTCGDECACKG